MGLLSVRKLERLGYSDRPDPWFPQGPEGMTALGLRSTCPASITYSHSKECLTNACTTDLKGRAGAYIMNKI